MTLDRARLLANVHERAKRLLTDGYRAEQIDDHLVEITSPKGQTYQVDTLAQSCDCPFHERYATCKHALGCDKLLADQRDAQREARRGQQEWEALHGLLEEILP